MLDEVHRARVIDARDAYEAAFRPPMGWRTGRSGRDGSEDGVDFHPVHPQCRGTLVPLRWALDRAGLVDAIVTAATRA